MSESTRGFFTDTTVCIGCKACEVACKQWNQLSHDGRELTGHSYDNTVALFEDGAWVLTAEDGGRSRLGDLLTTSAS